MLVAGDHEVALLAPRRAPAEGREATVSNSTSPSALASHQQPICPPPSHPQSATAPHHQHWPLINSQYPPHPPIPSQQRHLTISTGLSSTANTPPPPSHPQSATAPHHQHRPLINSLFSSHPLNQYPSPLPNRQASTASPPPPPPLNQYPNTG